MQIELRMMAAGDARPMCCDGRVSAIGRLVRERVASMALDWPALGFQRIETGTRTLRVAVTTATHAPAKVIALALDRAIRRETGDLVTWIGVEGGTRVPLSRRCDGVLR